MSQQVNFRLGRFYEQIDGLTGIEFFRFGHGRANVCYLIALLPFPSATATVAT